MATETANKIHSYYLAPRAGDSECMKRFYDDAVRLSGVLHKLLLCEDTTLEDVVSFKQDFERSVISGTAAIELEMITNYWLEHFVEWRS